MSTKPTALSLFSLFAVIIFMPIEAKSLRIPPIYPKEAAEQCIEGYVVLRYGVGEDGFATNIEVIESEPPGIFEEASLKNLARWRHEERGEGIRETTLEYKMEDCGSSAHNKSLKFVPRFALHRTRLTPRRLA